MTTQVSTTEIVAYNEFRAQLSELRDFNDKAVFDYVTPNGNREARSHVHKLRKTKAAVDVCRKKEKASSLEYGRKVDGEAKEIIGEIQDMIDVHQKPLLEIEAKEARRVKGILDLIEEIRWKVEDTDGISAEALRKRLTDIKGEVIAKELFQEFAEQAAGAKSMTVEVLERIIAERQKHEDEQAELARLRKEAEERDRKDREERIAKEAADRATREAEANAKRQQEEAKRREEKLKQDKERAIQATKDAQEKAIQDSHNADMRAVQSVQAAEARILKEAEDKKKREAAELAKREANKKHAAKINNEALGALIACSGIATVQAKKIIAAIASRQIPNVSIQY